MSAPCCPWTIQRTDFKRKKFLRQKSRLLENTFECLHMIPYWNGKTSTIFLGKNNHQYKFFAKLAKNKQTKNQFSAKLELFSCLLSISNGNDIWWWSIIDSKTIFKDFEAQNTDKVRMSSIGWNVLALKKERVQASEWTTRFLSHCHIVNVHQTLKNSFLSWMFLL